MLRGGACERRAFGIILNLCRTSVFTIEWAHTPLPLARLTFFTMPLKFAVHRQRNIKPNHLLCIASGRHKAVLRVTEVTREFSSI